MPGLRELGELAAASTKVATDSQERGNIFLESGRDETGQQLWFIEMNAPASGCRPFADKDADLDELISRTVRHFAPALKKLQAEKE